MSKAKPTLNQADLDLLKKRFVTKDNLKNLATKTDLVGKLSTLEFDDFKYDLDEKLSEHRSVLVEKLDKILGEVQTSRQEQKVIARGLTNNTNRLEKIES